jgi:hypothetical protein
MFSYGDVLSADFCGTKEKREENEEMILMGKRRTPFSSLNLISSSLSFFSHDFHRKRTDIFLLLPSYLDSYFQASSHTVIKTQNETLERFGVRE